MPLTILEYYSKSALPSCRPGEVELMPGEEVYIALKPKSALWPATIKATVTTPVMWQSGGRTYKFQYDLASLNGGPAPDSCDFQAVRCFSCCDAIREQLANPNPPKSIVLSGGSPVVLQTINPIWDFQNKTTFIFNPGPQQIVVGLKWDAGRAIVLSSIGGTINSLSINLLN